MTRHLPSLSAEREHAITSQTPPPARPTDCDRSPDAHRRPPAHRSDVEDGQVTGLERQHHVPRD